MADKYKFLFSLLPHFFILFFNKDFRNTSKVSFGVVLSFLQAS